VETYRFVKRQPDSHERVMEAEAKFNEEIKKATKNLGVDANEVKEQLLEAQGLWRQMLAIWGARGRVKASKLWILYALAIIVFIPAGGWALLHFLLPVWQPIIAKILTTLATLLALLAPFIKYAKSLLTPLSAAIEENRKQLETERLKLQG